MSDCPTAGWCQDNCTMLKHRPTDRAHVEASSPLRGRARPRAIVYITFTDYAKLGKNSRSESGLRTLWGGTHIWHIGPLDCCGHAAATLRDATRVMAHM